MHKRMPNVPRRTAYSSREKKQKIRDISFKKRKLKMAIYVFRNLFFSSSVSKTTKELLLEWDPSGEQKSVSVARDLRMPQFEMQKITTNKCHEENHMGK